MVHFIYLLECVPVGLNFVIPSSTTKHGILIDIERLVNPNCTKITCAHPGVIGSPPAKSEMNLTNGFRVMRFAEISSFFLTD